MRYEWKKISRTAVLLLVAMVLVNGVMFYNHCADLYDGYSLSQIEEVFSWPETAINARDEELGGPSLITGPDGLLTRQSLLKAVEARRNFDYSAYLQDLLNDLSLRIRSGFFGDENSFTVRSMEQTREVYQQLMPLQVTPTFSGSLEVWNGWQLSDLFFLVFGCVPCLFLLTQERRSGLYALLKPTKNGRSNLYFRKAFVMLGFVLLGFLLIYGVDLAICGHLFGFGDLKRPIQSAYGFQSCPAALTLVGYFMFYFGTKLLWGWALCSLFFALCAALRSVTTVLLSVAGILAVVVAMGASDNLWLRTFSLTRLSANEEILLNCHFLNFFGTPVRQLPVFLGFCGVLLLLSFGAGWFAFVKSPAVALDKRGGTLRLHVFHRHTNLLLHEGQKLLWTQGALALLVVLLLVQVVSYREFDTPNSEWEYYYRHYSSQLSGAPSSASDQFLADEAARFQKIYEEIEKYYALANGDTELAELMTLDLQNELRAEPAFLAAMAQYEGLQPGESYVYRTGYERLLGQEGQRDGLRNCIKLFSFLILAFSGVFAVEQETGVEVLQTTAGARRKLRRRKCIVCAVVMLMAALLAYLPQYFAVLHNYGLPVQGALASSLPILAAFPGNLTIQGALWFIAALHLLISAAAAALVLFLSRKTGNQVLTVLLGFGLLVLPTTVALLVL